MSPEQTMIAFYGGASLVIGATVGSFLNVCIHRWPHDRSLLPHSACPTCNTRLGVVDLVPVFSWVWLRGKCRTCKSPISPIYPMVEMLTALLGWLLFQRLVTTVEDLTAPTAITWAVYFFFICCLLIMALVDVRHHIIPDQTSSYALPFGVIGIAGLHYLEVTTWPVPTLTQSLWGAALGGGFLAVLAISLGFILRREALGWGDVKAIAMIGCFLGAFPGIWSILLIASVLSAVFGLLHLTLTRKRDYLPFAPSLAFTSVAHVLYGDHYLPYIFPTAVF